MPVGAGFIPARIGENKKMTEHKKLQPEIRFAGFTDDWEQRKVKDILTITRGKVLATSEVKSINNKVFRYPVYSSQTQNFGLMGFYSNYLFENAITWTTDGANAGDVNFREGKFFCTNVCGVLLSDKGYANRCIAEAINLVSRNYVSYVGNPKLMNNVMADIEINIPPTLEEQTQIGNFFKQLDDTIALHQRTLEKYQKLKISYLEKMFPKENELYPELRFPNFTDAWEQRKLGDVFGKIRNAFVGTATPYYVTSGHFYLESNNIKNGQINRDSEIFINEYFYQKQKDKWLKSGDMVMVQSGHVGHTAIIPDELHNSIAHALIMFTDYLDKSVPYFFNFFFQTNKAKREIDKITTGNTVKHILASDMKDFPIFLPSYEEQTQIGNFFKQLDDTIALHQREVEKYKKIKQSYLEKMFI